MNRQRDPRIDLREALAGTRALLLDMDGVLVRGGSVVSGAADAVDELTGRHVPFRMITNSSIVSRATLARRGASVGLRVPAEWISSALSVTAAYTRRAYPGRPLYVFATQDARTEFDGQHLVGHAAAARPDAEVAAVVIGDAPADLSYDHLNSAFRLVRRGARLIAMHRNPWWLTEDGPTLDAGAYVRGLEYATGKRALLMGKPAPALFRHALGELAGELGGLLAPREVAMVGDDLWVDVFAAQRLGVRGVLVLTGKHGEAEVAAARRAVGNRRPDAVAPALSDVVAALD